MIRSDIARQRLYNERLLGAAFAKPEDVVDWFGQVIGGWRRTIERDSVCVEIELLIALKRDEQRALERAVKRYAKFLGLPVRITAG